MASTEESYHRRLAYGLSRPQTTFKLINHTLSTANYKKGFEACPICVGVKGNTPKYEVTETYLINVEGQREEYSDTFKNLIKPNETLTSDCKSWHLDQYNRRKWREAVLDKKQRREAGICMHGTDTGGDLGRDYLCHLCEDGYTELVICEVDLECHFAEWVKDSTDIILIHVKGNNSDRNDLAKVARDILRKHKRDWMDSSKQGKPRWSSRERVKDFIEIIKHRNPVVREKYTHQLARSNRMNDPIILKVGDRNA
tara:strand:+ start:1561 stop:2325 length:765 start_codon:yes stop_codon:yes gene_type:complete